MVIVTVSLYIGHTRLAHVKHLCTFLFHWFGSPSCIRFDLRSALGTSKLAQTVMSGVRMYFLTNRRAQS
jgi:hypothetical protein